MGVSWCLWLILVTLIHISSFHCIISQPSYYRIANHTTISWTNSDSAPYYYFTFGRAVRFILLRETSLSKSPKFACGFFCEYYTCDPARFGVFIMVESNVYPHSEWPKLVWSANRNNPVRENATLHLTGDGDLVLRDADGTLVWSTNTAGRSVVGLNLTEMGNLVLFDKNNATVWESFDHPTDTLLLGQKLFSDQKLTASASATNWSEGGLYSLSITNEGLFAFVESNPPLVYYQKTYDGGKESTESNYGTLLNGSFSLFITSFNTTQPFWKDPVPQARSVQFMKLESDGHLRIYDWVDFQWEMVEDVLTESLGECDFPMVCGTYGICSTREDGTGDCSCPTITSGKSRYFEQKDDRHPNLGCFEVSPLSCNASKYHRLLELKNLTTHSAVIADINNTDLESCKHACLKNCSCKAALFYLNGNCYLPFEIFSLADNEAVQNFKAVNDHQFFVKVQINPTTLPPSSEVPLKKKTSRNVIILAYSLGAFFGLFLIIGIFIFILRKKNDVGETEEDYLDQVPGMPMRFSYEDLKAATDNFSKKLGEGGFGSVFEGTLSNDNKIAVKCLDGFGQVKKSFLAEVETIGSIHHVNLVRLVGYCAAKSQRLLVYEFMCNGSLDRWIFHRNQELALDWQIRRKIILDIAKGLAYLHEECRQKIFHLDIKPKNILLDENFNAKVSDFGLSKLIDRDQSQIVTTMRGTPGYMAPEWSSSVITEKVDVYSFGVVVMEILCGRKNLDRYQPEEGMHLLSLFTRNAEEGQLLDMVDKHSEDMQLHGEEVVEMMRLAGWCLQGDFARRPSMSAVVKVLEGSVDVEDNLEYDFTNPPVPRNSVGHMEVALDAATPLMPSTLSGPRLGCGCIGCKRNIGTLE